MATTKAMKRTRNPRDPIRVPCTAQASPGWSSLHHTKTLTRRQTSFLEPEVRAGGRQTVVAELNAIEVGIPSSTGDGVYRHVPGPGGRVVKFEFRPATQ